MQARIIKFKITTLWNMQFKVSLMQITTIKLQFVMANLSLNISVVVYEERVRIFYKNF